MTADLLGPGGERAKLERAGCADSWPRWTDPKPAQTSAPRVPAPLRGDRSSCDAHSERRYPSGAAAGAAEGTCVQLTF
jgi:hypothetical protein